MPSTHGFTRVSVTERRAIDPRPLAAWGLVALLFAVSLGRAGFIPAEPTVDKRGSASVTLPRLPINALAAEQLCLLPGVGPALAARIVAHRDAHGPFRSIDELAHVPGIGPRTVERLVPLLTVDGP